MGALLFVGNIPFVTDWNASMTASPDAKLPPPVIDNTPVAVCARIETYCKNIRFVNDYAVYDD